MDFCTDYNFLNGLIIVKFIYNAALIILPVVMLAMGTFDGFKAVMSGKADELKGILFNMGAKTASILIILLMPKIIHIVFDTMDSYDGIYNKLSICINNANKDVVAGLKRAQEKELKGYEATSQKYLASYDKQKYVRRTADNSAMEVSGKGNFVKYDLSDEQINFLAKVAMNEQASLKGYAAEASLFANLFEKNGRIFGQGADGLVSYVKNSKWFPDVSLDRFQNVTDEIRNVVKAVLVDGKRTLPAYVDEQVYIGAIASASNDGVSFAPMDKSKYIPFKTHVKQSESVQGGEFTFYSFPDTNSDPFGYTSEERRTQLGDDCYSFAQLSS